MIDQLYEQVGGSQTIKTLGFDDGDLGLLVLPPQVQQHRDGHKHVFEPVGRNRHREALAVGRDVAIKVLPDLRVGLAFSGGLPPLLAVAARAIMAPLPWP